MKIHLVICKAANCTDPSSELEPRWLTYADPLPIDAKFTEGAFFNITCRIGSYWEDGSNVKNMTCSAEGKWNFPQNCTSK